MDILVPEGEISVLDFIKFEKNEIRRFHLEWGGGQQISIFEK